MENEYDLIVLAQVNDFIESLPDKEKLILKATVDTLKRKDFDSIHAKTLKGPIKELIVKRRRFIFCIENDTIYFLKAFTKKTQKTPRNEIEISEKLYKLLVKQLQLIKNQDEK